MMRSLFSGVSGLRNHQSAMDVIGANISNINTVGYKGGRSNFSDVISQTLQGASSSTTNRGGTNPIQIGLGVGLASVDTLFTGGSFQPTGKQTDLAIQGQGFFVLGDGSNSYYTRAGNFDFDSLGNYLVPGSGMRVQGWQAVNGLINTTGPITNIQVPIGTTMPASPTATVNYANNLSGDSNPGDPVTTSITVYDSLGNPQSVSLAFMKSDASANTWIAKASLANSTIPLTNALREITFTKAGAVQSVHPITVATPTASVALTTTQLDNTTGSVRDAYYTVFDAQSSPHSLRMRMTQTSANHWTYSVTEPNNTSNTSSISGTIDYGVTTPAVYTYSAFGNIQVGSGASAQNVTFNTAGMVHTPPAIPPLNTFQSAYAATYTAPNLADNPILFTPPGAAQSSITLNLAPLTQYGGQSTIQAANQNGYTSGNLQTTTIDTSGVLVGKFSNGQTQNLAQVALASFNNPGGLTRVGDTLFGTSNNSGVAQVGTSGTGGRGTLSPGTLEMSNVDLADQFSKMIITQRGFQANSKIITVTDEMLQELANLKR